MGRREYGRTIYEIVAKAVIFMPMEAGKSVPDEWAGKYPIIGDVKPEEWDSFHHLLFMMS